MTTLKTTIAAAALAAVLAGPAAADVVNLGRIAGTEWWTLYANPERELCSATALYPGMLISLIVNQHGLTLALGSPRWRFRDGAVYDVVVATDGHRWTGPMIARGTDMLESTGGLKEQAIRDLAATTTLRIEDRNGAVIGNFRMDGSRRAIGAAADCATRVAQRSQPFREAPATDPFTPAPDRTDPFGPPAEYRM